MGDFSFPDIDWITNAANNGKIFIDVIGDRFLLQKLLK